MPMAFKEPYRAWNLECANPRLALSALMALLHHT